LNPTGPTHASLLLQQLQQFGFVEGLDAQLAGLREFRAGADASPKIRVGVSVPPSDLPAA